MRIFLFIFLSLLFSNISYSQGNKSGVAKEDSLLKIVAKTKEPLKIIDAYISLAGDFFMVNEAKEYAYLEKAEFIADQSRDRKLIVETYGKIFRHCQKLLSNKERYDKASLAIEKGLKLAKEYNLTELSSVFCTRKAMLYRQKSDFKNALKFHEDAENYAELSGIDSIKVKAIYSHGLTLNQKDDDILAFKKYSAALDLAEEIKEKDMIGDISLAIAYYYQKLEQQENAKDYYMKALNIRLERKEDLEAMDIYASLANLHAENKDLKLAQQYLGKLKEISLKSKEPRAKAIPIFAEANIMLSSNDAKSGEYIQKNPKIYEELLKYGLIIDAYKAKGLMFSFLKQKDSAEIYYKKVREIIAKNPNPNASINLSYILSIHYKQFKDSKNSIINLEDGLNISTKVGLLSYQEFFRKQLDSLYLQSGDKQKYFDNKLKLIAIKDSLNNIKKSKDLVNLELDLENKRVERDKKSELEELRKKHNLQYLGITAFIFTAFIILVLLGKLKVRRAVIRALGFISFILLFEFIILLADQQIHHLTHGDPLTILLIKIVLIALLMPLHHFLEHKVMHHLTKNYDDVGH